MKIGIISDTPANSGEDIPQEVAKAFEGQGTCVGWAR